MNDLLDIIRSGEYVVLDTETTGVHREAEIVQCAVIDSQGKTLLDRLIKPVFPIPEEATAIHGITNEQVKDAALFPYEELTRLLNGRNVIVYNAQFDSTMLYQSMRAAYLSNLYIDWRTIANFHCAMLAFARVYGDWDQRRKSYRWKKLVQACAYYHIPVIDAHNALADCQMTLRVCQAMAGILPVQEPTQEELPF